MAYFLPSYFQKRLLRYALSRLDFLESDALDLDNLAFTIGQRSVVELKNVGVQVSKVVDRLKLPAAIVPQHASIRLVRITIPADLHVSGIEIEIDGVNIEVDLDPTRVLDDGKRSSTRPGTAPSHKDIANQPRIASTTTHDPGGVPIIPSSQDLAASFLQAEPDQEKKELQAAVESRSTYLQRSSVSLESSTSDAGYGMPEGFSLPGFVATFFTGVADRLSVRIRNVAVILSTYILNDQSVREPLQFVLKVEEVELQSLKSILDANGDLDLRRSLQISGIEFLLSSQGDLLSQKSAVSSPKLSKVKSSTLNFSRQESLLPNEATGESDSRSSHGLESSTNSTASSRMPPLGLGVDDSMLESSQMFDPSLVDDDYASPGDTPESDRLSPAEPRSDETNASRRESYSSFDSPNEPQHGGEDLAQSRYFSHDDAESMYMSALSATPSAIKTMPGGLHEAVDDSVPASLKSGNISENTLTPMEDPRPATGAPGIESNANEPVSDKVRDEPSESAPYHSQPLNQCSKRLVLINQVHLKLPVKAQSDSNIGEHLDEMPSQSRYNPKRDRVPYGARQMSASHGRVVSEISIYGISQEQKVDLEDKISHQISVGDIEIALDINVCHVLLKATTQLNQALSVPRSTPETTSTKPTDLHLKILIQSITLNMMEFVPEYTTISKQRAPTESTFSVRGDDLPLLQLQLLKAQASAVLRDGKIDQKISIHRLALYRESEKMLSFFDPASLQDSFVASSVVLEPDDITFRQVDNRIDISTKPLRIALDLVILDEVLSRSGGLSSLLELGNSVASAKDNEPRAHSTHHRRRSVRFGDVDIPSEPPSRDDNGLKLNARISGVLLDLVGSQSSIQVKSSSVKLAYRSGKVRTNISSVSIRGPIARSNPSNDLIFLRFGDIQLTYLNMPEEEDLDRLLQLLAPSSEKYEQDDDIMVDTLLRQRRKGGVMRLTIQHVDLSVDGLAWTQRLTQLGEEISKLSTVTKYLPEDDRPGILTFAIITKFTVRLEIGKSFGSLVLKANLLEGAHISVPSLMAAQITSFNLSRGKNEVLVRELIPNMQESILMGPPMLMCRFIADEMEPTIKLKLSNACLEYSVPILLSITQLAENVQKELSQEEHPLSPRASEISTSTSEASELSRKVKLSLALQTSAVSLQPLDSPANALFVFTDALITHSAKNRAMLATLEIKKASIMIIDDISRIGHGISGADPKLYFDQNDQVQELVKSGFVPVGSISAAAADIKVAEDRISSKQYVDVEFRNNLLFLETCADSTQTLIQILGALSPPSAPSKIAKYRTEIIPLNDMLASFTGNAFVSETGPELGLQIDEDAEGTPTPSALLPPRSPIAEKASSSDDEDETFMNDLHLSQAEDEQHDQMTESSILSGGSSMPGSVHVAPVNITADDEASTAGSIVMHSMLDLRDNHFVQKTSVGGTAHRWDSARNTYGMGSETSVQQSPLKVRIRDVHIIWNLFDGYDWQNTRDIITQAVRDVEDKAFTKQRKRDSHRSPGPEEEDESVVGDVLFNSIYISIPTNRDPRELTNAINMELGDAASETGSYATSTTITATSTKRYSGPRPKPRRLKLNRSKQHKMTFELEGIAADFLMFPPDSGEVESSIDIRVRKVEVFDHVPTSTWKKFATYMHEAGEREVGTDMVHIELLNVKPVAELAASEMVMKLTVLPLRLHVDQDALDFLTRFFEFKDDRTPPSTTQSTPPFLQRVEVNPIRLRLDFKPKRVDYAGLKSGRTTEFMNFFILDRADMVLRRVILYGVSGFDRLGIMLNNIWTPDVRNNQLPGVLAGLAPVRSLVDVGSGVRDLVAIPIREYKKDGRIVRSIQKGALAFAKTTTTELVNLGAKLAIGTQTVLQNAEGVLAPQNKPQSGFTSDSDDDEGPKQISHYADQPLGIVQGLRGAYASLERDLLLAKDAIVAVPGEIMADGSATGAAKVILKQSPTIILRPAIGVTKAMGQAFLGAGNTLDKGNRKRIEDVSQLVVCSYGRMLTFCRNTSATEHVMYEVMIEE